MTASERIRAARENNKTLGGALPQTPRETRKVNTSGTVQRQGTVMSPAERRTLWLRLYREELAKLVPNCGRLSGQQVAYAKGRVTLRFKELGL